MEVIILGGGLSGLALAYRLGKAGVSYTLLEARERLGGRILTKQEGNASLEMGATWHWNYHVHYRQWLQEMAQDRFPQYQEGLVRYDPDGRQPGISFAIPPQDPSFRVVGGTQQLTEAIASALDASRVHLNQPAASIRKSEAGWSVLTGIGRDFHGTHLVSTLPPHLFLETIQVTPPLPESLRSVMAITHTWMGDSIKYAVRYAAPFWREAGWAGAGFSQVGPATEVHDHTTANEQGFALKGFLTPGIRALPRAQWEEALILQLVRMYGEAAQAHVGVHLMDWAQEPYTYAQGPEVLPHQNQGHAVYQQGYFEDTLFWAGAEASPHYPGYMEGALYSAERVAQQLLS